MIYMQCNECDLSSDVVLNSLYVVKKRNEWVGEERAT